METELKNFVVVWLTVLASLFYCYTIGKFIPKGTTRLLALLPVICLFFILHLNLTTIHFGSITCFFIAWLANFKLLLFAFDQGPLSSSRSKSISFPKFILIACLPIRIHDNPSPKILEKPPENEIKEYPTPQNSEKPPKYEIKEYPSPQNLEKPPKFEFKENLSPQNGTKEYPSHQTPKKSPITPKDSATRVLIIAILLQIYKHKEQLHPNVLMLVYGIHVYVSLELLLALMTSLARGLARVELEPPFDKPYLSSSLQDFWGRRWNLIVASILRPTVYVPVRWISSRLIGRKWASVPAIIATFFVSGLMHELVFYNMGRTRPTWEVTCFFLIHGVCLVVEICLKRALNGKFRLPPAVSGPFVVAFVVATGLWLFIPSFLKCDTDVRVRRELAAALEFVKSFGFGSLNVVSKW